MTDRERYRQRVIAVATNIVASMMINGEIEKSEEAIKAAMPEAIRLAKDAVTASEEFVS